MVRFWEKVDKSKGENSCWEWTRYKDKDGYGQLRFKGRMYLAHRFSYMTYVGAIPEGMLICHKCDNPSCVNPDHLFIGTHLDNKRDCIKKGRLNPRKGGDHHCRLHPELIIRGGEHYKAKLSNSQALEIRNLHSREGIKLKDAIRKYKISRSSFYRIINNKSYRTIGDSREVQSL